MGKEIQSRQSAAHDLRGDGLGHPGELETIRCASLADLAAVTALEAACFPAAEAATEESLRQRLQSYPRHFWVLEREGRIIAMLNGMVTDEPNLQDEMYEDAALHREDGAWQMIFGVDTHPDFRRQGCAGRLLRHAIAEARREHRRGLVLTCKEGLLSFYGSFGFENEGVSGSVHGGAVWYQMRLSLNAETEEHP